MSDLSPKINAMRVQVRRLHGDAQRLQKMYPSEDVFRRTQGLLGALEQALSKRLEEIQSCAKPSHTPR